MGFHPSEVVEKARMLRERGLSITKIAEHLNIFDTTIARWCSDIPSKNPYHLHVQSLKEVAKERRKEIVDQMTIDQSTAQIALALLYWCEGSKHPSTNFIAFANSDVELVKTFLKLFRRGFHPKEEKFRIHLQLHTTHDRAGITKFWSDALNIPIDQFYPPTITSPTNNMKRREYMGTCTIRYYDVYLLLEIMGIYEKIAEKVTNTP